MQTFRTTEKTESSCFLLLVSFFCFCLPRYHPSCAFSFFQLLLHPLLLLHHFFLQSVPLIQMLICASCKKKSLSWSGSCAKCNLGRIRSRREESSSRTSWAEGSWTCSWNCYSELTRWFSLNPPDNWYAMNILLSFIQHTFSYSCISFRENPAWIPETFWQTHKNQFPRIEKFARHFACILPSSARIWAYMVSHEAFLDRNGSSHGCRKGYSNDVSESASKGVAMYVRHSAIDAEDDEELDKLWHWFGGCIYVRNCLTELWDNCDKKLFVDIVVLVYLPYCQYLNTSRGAYRIDVRQMSIVQ